MPERFSFGIPQLSISGGQRPAPRRADAPFRILVAGDFSGRENRSCCESMQGRRPRVIDLDRFDAVLAAMAPQLALELPRGEKVEISFRRLDDFHPDRIWESNAFFAPHRQMRGELRNPSTFAAAMAALAGTDTPTAPPPAADRSEDTWARLTGLSPSRPAPSQGPASAVEALVRNAVAGHLVSGPDPRQAEMVAAFDNALSGQMRALLHHPAFQALESSWRGVDFLLRNLDGDDSLEVALLDVSREELAADLDGTRGVSAWGDLLLARQTGEAPLAIVAGLFPFSPAVDADAELLARLAHVSAAAGVPFVGGAGGEWVKLALANAPAAELPVVWQALRSLPVARFAGLAAPRFLLRQPYGRTSDPIDHFTFEEAPANTLPGSLLWGNSALLAAFLAAEAWRGEGWGFAPPVNAPVTGLPVYVYSDDGGKSVAPCAESVLTERAAENLLAYGVIPVAAVKDRDSVRLLRFPSLSIPASGLFTVDEMH